MLIVKKSGIPNAGKGLFTTVPIKKDEKIVEYKGDKLTWTQVKERYKNIESANYLFWVGPNHWIDAEPTVKELARYANDAKGLTKSKELKSNSEYRVIKRVPYIVATKNIPAGAEILVDYGDDYWINHVPSKKKK